MSKHTSIVLGVLVSILPAALPCGAQYFTKKESSSAQGGLTMNLVKTGLYTISGGGGNSVLRLTAHGLVLVDGKVPGTYDSLQAQISRVSKQPVLVLINTGSLPWSTGNNARFRQAGTGILAQQNLASHTGSEAAPAKTFDRQFDMHLGDIDIQALHFGSARTDADSVVYFPNLKTVAVGGLFVIAPNPDYSAGGSLVGWSRTLGDVLKLDFDTVIPSEGSVVKRSQLEELREKIDSFIARGTTFVHRGGSKDQLLAAVQRGSLGLAMELNDENLNGLYAELTGDIPKRR